MMMMVVKVAARNEDEWGSSANHVLAWYSVRRGPQAKGEDMLCENRPGLTEKQEKCSQTQPSNQCKDCKANRKAIWMNCCQATERSANLLPPGHTDPAQRSKKDSTNRVPALESWDGTAWLHVAVAIPLGHKLVSPIPFLQGKWHHLQKCLGMGDMLVPGRFYN